MKDVGPEKENEPENGEHEEESGKMSFLEHLDEFRTRIVRIISWIGVGFVASFFFHKQLYSFLSRPVRESLPAGINLTYTKLTDPFSIYVWVSVVAGIFLTIPFTMYEVWRFIAPGLYRREKKYIVPFLASAVVLFVGGGAFAYYVVLPRAYAFFVQFGSDFTPMITIDTYLDLTLGILLGFGAMFEMPVIIAFLSMWGLVTAKFLLKQFKYALLIIFILAAIVSPTPDAFNQCLYAAPMIVLYIISIGVAAIFGVRRKKKGLV